jgi:hypothetical protein
VDQKKWLIKDGHPFDAKAMTSRIRQLLMSLAKMTPLNKRITELMKPTDLTARVISQGRSIGSTLQTPWRSVNTSGAFIDSKPSHCSVYLQRPK